MEPETSTSELGLTQSSGLSWITRLSRTRVSSLDSIGLSSASGLRLQGLDDVLKTIQKLRVPRYFDQEIERTEAVGQGETYLVERCIVASRVLAIKTLKLGDLSKDTTKFLRRLHSVLLELRVMHHNPLRSHPNILDLVAYGWSDQPNRILPYILTEYSPYGTFREYLLSKSITIRSKEILLGDVALGTADLHLTSIVHGDLKLENVLIFHSWDRPAGAIAKVADFGHSLLLFGIGNEHPTPRYEGTPLYNAPEVSSQLSNRLTCSQLYKCDVWTFGLLAWETLLNGDRYIGHVATRKEIVETSVTLPTSNEFSSMLQSAKDAIPSTLDPLQRAFFRGLFNRTLQVDAEGRTSDLAALPVVSKWHDNCSTKLEANLALYSGTSDWSFEMFRPENGHEILWKIQEQVFQDFKRCHKLSDKDTKRAGESAWELALCHFLEFGTSRNIELAANFAREAQSCDHLLGGFSAVLTSGNLFGATCNLKWYNSMVTSAFRTTPSLSRDLSLGFRCDNHPEQMRFANYMAFSLWLSSELKRLDLYTALVQVGSIDESLDVSDVLVLFRDMKLLAAISTNGIKRSRHHLDAAGFVPNSNQTPLVYAIRTGLPEAASAFLEKGESLRAQCIDGTNAFHWLFLLGDSVLSFARNELRPCRNDAAIHVPSHTASVLHKQWPLHLLGTPIAYAIAAGSKDTVLALLELGVSPTALVYRWGQFEADDPRSHWNSLHLAIKYHLVDILDILLAHVKFLRVLKSPVPYACALSFSSLVERRAIHGKDQEKNLSETVARVENIKDASMMHTVFGYDKQLRRATPSGITPLMQAIDFNDTAVVAALIDADPALAGEILRDPKVKQSYTFPVHFAAPLASLRNISSSVDILRTLNNCSESGFLAIDSNGCSPLHLAVTGPYDWASRYILQEAPRLLNMRDSEGKTALLSSRSAVNSDYLLAQGADIHSVDDEGRSALHWACLHEALDIVQLLLRHQASISHESLSWGTPLHCAILRKNRDIAVALLQNGAAVNARDKAGDTPINMAAGSSRKDMVQLLLDYKADATIENDLGKTPLCTAIESGDLMVVRVLASATRLDSVVRSTEHETSLHLCARTGDANIMQLLLQNLPASIRLDRNINGHSPFLLAATYSHVQIGKLLLDAGLVDLRETDHSGNTAAHLVLLGPLRYNKPPEVHRLAFCDLLRDYGAPLFVRNIDGQLPWDIALGDFCATQPVTSQFLVFLLNCKACQAQCVSPKKAQVYDTAYLLDRAVALEDATLCIALIQSHEVGQNHLEDIIRRQKPGKSRCDKCIKQFSNILFSRARAGSTAISQYMTMDSDSFAASVREYLQDELELTSSGWKFNDARQSCEHQSVMERTEITWLMPS